jgi:hypothetical protein
MDLGTVAMAVLGKITLALEQPMVLAVVVVLSLISAQEPLEVALATVQ